MPNQKFPMTPDGYKKLQDRLKHLKSVERSENIRAIEEARAHGDLSENAEYEAAKDRQGLINSMIENIEHKLALAQVIDPSKLDMERIAFGATVSIANIDTNEEFTYQIVGIDEVDVKKGKISIESPIARALIGKEDGDETVVNTPKGKVSYEILSVEYK